MALNLTPDELAAAQAGDADLDTALGEGTTSLHPPLDAWANAGDYAQEGETAADVRSTWKLTLRAVLAAAARLFAPKDHTHDGTGTGPAKGITEPPAVGYGTGTAGASDAYAPIDHTHDLAAHSHSYASVSHSHSVTSGDVSEANIEEAADFLGTTAVGLQRTVADGVTTIALTMAWAGPFGILKPTGEVAHISPIFGAGFARMEYTIPLLLQAAAQGNHLSVESWVEVDGGPVNGSRARWTVQQIVTPGPESPQHLTLNGGGTIEIEVGQAYDVALMLRVLDSTAAGDLVEIDATPRLSIHAVESAI